MFRNGVRAPVCATGSTAIAGDATQAAPDPCIEHIGSSGVYLTVTVLTSHASTWAVGTPTAGSIQAACPEGTPDARYADVAPDATHAAAIDCAAALGLAKGTGNGRFGPAEQVTRGQMASFLVRLLERSGVALPSGAAGPFRDARGTTHETAINQLRRSASRADGPLPPSTRGPRSPGPRWRRSWCVPTSSRPGRRSRRGR